ncbi:hypothetical protein ACS0TY_003686 [Phlomoides rotata]
MTNLGSSFFQYHNQSDSPHYISWEFDDLSLPFNVNDSEEMLLYGVLAQGVAKESSETDSHPNCKEEKVDSTVKKRADPRLTKVYAGDPGGYSLRRLGIPCGTASEYNWVHSTARRPP